MLPLIPVSHAARLRAGLSLIVALVTAAAFTVSCQKVPLLAPSGSTITLTASTNALPVGGTTQLVAQIIEPSGTPPHSGTQITFTTTLGTIQPDQVETDASGRAVATFNAGSANGTATITAISGGSSASGNNAIKISLGTAAVGGVRVSANPTQVPAIGGTSTITADVFDVNGNPLAGAPVVFTTSAGSLSNTISNTATTGIATTVLLTSTQATVTATVGATGAGGATGATGGTGSTAPTTGQTSGTVTVSVVNPPTLVITQPSSPPSEGLPATFTFAVTAATAGGAAIRDVTVNWGDGSATQDLGPIVGSQAISHTYRVANSYTITATVTDAFGQTQTYQTQVGVVVTSTPSVNITPSVPSSCGTAGTTSCNVTFTVQITPPTGVGVTQVTINYGDGQADKKGGVVGTLSVSHTYTYSGTGSVQFPVSVDVLDTLGRTTTGTAIAVIR